MKEQESFGIYGKYMGTIVVDLPTGIRHYLYDTPWRYNLITNAGRTWLINRGITNAVNFVEAIAIGTGITPPLLSQNALITETSREATTNSSTTSTVWEMIFTATFQASVINGTTEIGVLDNTVAGDLLARNTHTALQVPPGSNIIVQYIFGLMTAKILTTWTLVSGNVYSVSDNVLCSGIVETDTGNGYNKQTSIGTVQAEAGSYWHDATNNLTYVHCSDGASPLSHNIIVIST
jgi:hypothetical protein